MELRIENMGPLKDVTLPIRSMNVIIGPNHQGKTWLAYALYVVAKIGDLVPFTPAESFESVLGQLQGGARDAVIAHLHTRLRMNTQHARKNLSAVFRDSSNLFRNTQLTLSCSDRELLDSLASRLEETDDSRILPRSMEDMAHFEEWDAEAVSHVDHSINPLGAPFLLPAERNGLVLVYKPLVNQLALQSIPEFGGPRKWGQSLSHMRTSRPPTLPAPVWDFFRFLVACEYAAQTIDSPHGILADVLEQALLGGHQLRWSAEEGGGNTLQLAVDQERVIGLHNASSAVKQIAALLLWLRSAPQERLLIIDEPELNLHPVAQAKLLEGLAVLVSLGVKVVLTTHSPYLISHLNNLIAGHPTDEALRARQAQHLYLKDPRAFMTPESVGAWHLDQGVLRDLYEPEWGIRSDSLGDASEEIHRLYYAIRAEESPDEVG